jgi:hypothetical protein
MPPPHKDIPEHSQEQLRNGNTTRCAQCGRILTPKRASHRLRYCSSACKKYAFRLRTLARVRPTQNSTKKSNGCRGGFAGRAPAISGPKHVIAIELTGDWIEAFSADGVRSLIRKIRPVALVERRSRP